MKNFLVTACIIIHIPICGMNLKTVLALSNDKFEKVEKKEFTKIEEGDFQTFFETYYAHIPGWLVYAEKRIPPFGTILWWVGGWQEEKSGDIYPLEQFGACYLFAKLQNLYNHTKDNQILDNPSNY